MITLGDVIRYREEEYVYLAGTEEVIYAAKIIDKCKSENILSRYAGVQCDPRRSLELKQNVLYYFVELHTEEYKKRIAHLANTENDAEDYEVYEVCGRLELDDIKEIKEEILGENSASPGLLKKLIADIEIS